MPENIAGSMLVSVLNPDGTLVGSGAAAGPTPVTIVDEPVDVTVVGQPVHVLVDGQPTAVTVSGQPITTTATISGQPISTTLTGQPIAVTTSTSTIITAQNTLAPNTPLAGLSVVSVQVPATGRYRVATQILFTGTGTPVANNNYLFDPISLPTVRLFSAIEKGVVYTNEYIYNLTGNDQVRITPNANEAASVTVVAQIVLHRIS